MRVRSLQPEGLQQIGALELRCLGQRRLEKLTHHTEGKIALQLGPSRPEHPHAGICGHGPRRREERRLADPRRPFDHEEPPVPLASVGQRRPDLRQLVAPLEQRSGGRGALMRLERAAQAPVRAPGTARLRARGSRDGRC